jgi:hypothetical protein
MPYQYLRDDSTHRVTITLTDPLTVTERIGAVERQLADGAWSYGVLVDARGLEPFTPDRDDMRTVVERLAGLVAAHGPRGPVVIVSTKSSVIGAGQLYNLLDRTTGPIEVFWDMGDARRALDRMCDANGNSTNA